jgi:hypothetical protein
MHRAVRIGGTVAELEELLRCGARVDSVDEDGNSALHAAALAGEMPVLQWLLDRGADPLFRGQDGRTALHAAAEAGHQDACEALCQACLSCGHRMLLQMLQAEDSQGKSAAQLAVAGHHLDVVRMLLGAHSQAGEHTTVRPSTTALRSVV